MSGRWGIAPGPWTISWREGRGTVLRANAFTLEFLVEYAAGFAAEFVALSHPLHGKIVVVHEPRLFQLVKHVRNNPGVEVKRDKAFLKLVAGPGPLIEQ